MRKEGKKEFEEVDLSKPKPKANADEPEEKYIIKNGDEYPNRLICHVKVRYEADEYDADNNKTGVFV